MKELSTRTGRRAVMNKVAAGELTFKGEVIHGCPLGFTSAGDVLHPADDDRPV